MKTQVLKFEKSENYGAYLDKAVSFLRKGRLVAFPTETVYGLGADARNADAVHRLYEVKKRPLHKPCTILVARKVQVKEYVPILSTVGERLVKRLWPGPLTIIFSRTDGEAVGLRMPAHTIASDLVLGADTPILAPSANLSGKSPPTNAQEVLQGLQDKIDLLLDDGATRYKEASTVVRVEGEDWQMVREGVLSERTLKRAVDAIIVFVCTGNSCRSPMAEGMTRLMLSKKLGISPEELEEAGFIITSAGVAAAVGAPASDNAMRVMEEEGLSILDHLSQPVSGKMLYEADYIYCMTGSHMRRLREMAPEEAEKIMLLDPEGEDIRDPLGGDLETYRRCAARIKRGIKKILEEI
jgi:protein-tyrosine phosphatase